MRHPSRVSAIAAALVLPVLANAQHSHGGSMEMPRRHETDHASPPPAPPPRGILPDGSPRQIEVLILSYGFSPASIHADAGEEVVLLVRRIDDSGCPAGLVVPGRPLAIALPVGETVPVTLELDRPETVVLRCASTEMQTSIVVERR